MGMAAKKIAVLGTGANGASVAADIAEAGHDVVLIDQWPAHIEADAAERFAHRDAGHHPSVAGASLSSMRSFAHSKRSLMSSSWWSRLTILVGRAS